MNTVEMDNRILVVDDNPDNLELTGHLLDSKGFNYATTTSSMEALVMMENERFQLVISDLMMPHMDGIALLRAVREKYSDLPVVMMTAHGTISTAVEAMRIGAFDYIQKPFNAEEVTLLVERAVAHRTLRVENEALKISLRDMNRSEEHTSELQSH